MLIVKNKRYVRKHVVGGAGIFDTVSNFFKRLSSSSGVSLISKAAATDIGKHTINAAKTVGKELATSAISTAKDIAIDKGKQLIAKASPMQIAKARPETKPPLSGVATGTELTSESKEILANLVRRIAQPHETSSPPQWRSHWYPPQNSAGQGLNTNKSKAVRKQNTKAVKIQDMVRTLNGGGLRLA